ncbi:protein-export membrane protein SecD [Candidatus Kaiserbacteria bacterium RIFCSPHIGHO2_01_FULL_56_24]|uniref:Protein translocase subunit SecD n=1 Tax=Candidatus Kaiserbacteria bacterium RIFCSPHIGHO2_01_FULL_56_24 TaxID=1798487 RepID=A0A1F6DDZ0_9BACT|nr:MAG: protein-export membrane protein SecD [Candidatus Kaiserbacteria bacterium RIFCSPHIGHO2_01_FULL_56_24]
MWKYRLWALVILLLGGLLGWYVYHSQVTGSRPFRLGLDLSGGTQLIYKADLNAIAGGDVNESMNALRDTIERRVNIFGVAEPLVQTEKGGTLAGEAQQRLIVELPGVTDTEKAIAMIGATPTLEFRMLKDGATVPEEGQPIADIDALFEPAAVTGKNVERAELQFGNGGGLANEATVVLHFNSEGKQIFADLTGKNVGKIFGIFLDGVPISTPVIREAIPDGTAVISGNFTPDSAKELVRNLNYGALPVPIELLTTETVGGTLGGEAVKDGIMAGLWGIGAVALFMVLWYRLPGLVAVIALSLYIIANLAIFKLLPVTLTAAGIAGFILSIGMAVDANILIFERMKEELKAGKNTRDAIHDGFARAWLSIRDSNISSMITAVILFWFGTSLIKGFALVFGLGVLVSMLTAISISRTFLLSLGIAAEKGFARFLFGSGVK